MTHEAFSPIEILEATDYIDAYKISDTLGSVNEYEDIEYRLLSQTLPEGSDILLTEANFSKAVQVTLEIVCQRDPHYILIIEIIPELREVSIRKTLALDQMQELIRSTTLDEPILSPNLEAIWEMKGITSLLYSRRGYYINRIPFNFVTFYCKQDNVSIKLSVSSLGEVTMKSSLVSTSESRDILNEDS